MRFSKLLLILLLNVILVSCVNNKTLNQETEVEYFKSGDLFYHVSEGNDSNVELVGDTSGISYEGLQGKFVIPAVVEYNSKQYNVITIEDSVFAGCEGITSLTISNGIKKIGNSTFSGCTSLESVSLPDGLISMGVRAFHSCESLKSVALPKGLSEIKEYTFFGCSALENISVPDNIVKIGQSALDETAWLVNQPDGVIYAGNVVYKYRSTSQKEVEIVLRKGTVGISDFAFFVHPEISNITIPTTVEYIGMSAFLNCTGLSSIQIPYGVKEICKNAFCGCKTLVLASLPESITLIDDRAFQDCVNLKTIRIPRNVSKMGVDVFKGCKALKNITLYNSKPIAMNARFSENLLNNVTLVVPEGALEDYKEAEYWKDFKNIEGKDL